MLKLAQPVIPENAICEVADVLRSGNLVQGRHVAAFEQELAAYLGVQYATVVSSGTAALHLSLLALGIGPGDEVIVPGFTFPATVNVVELVGAKPVVVDVGEEDLCMSPQAVERAITAQTRAIMPVHEFGMPADMKAIQAAASPRGISVIEDAACALGAEFEGKKVGTFGECGCFSFHPRKAITTGEGGLIVTSEKTIHEKVRLLRNHGLVMNDGHYDIQSAGLNYRMTEMQAVLGRHQLQKFEEIVGTRIKIAREYDRYLSGIPWLHTPSKIPGRKMVYQTYHTILGPGVERDQVIARLRANEIDTNLGAQAICMMSYYKNKYILKLKDFPNSVKAFQKGLALPIGEHLREEDPARVAGFLSHICT